MSQKPLTTAEPFKLTCNGKLFGLTQARFPSGLSQASSVTKASSVRLSTEERELEALKQHKKFKALPFNKKMFERQPSQPKMEKPEATKFAEFTFRLKQPVEDRNSCPP